MRNNRHSFKNNGMVHGGVVGTICILIVAGWLTGLSAHAQTDYVLYDDAVHADWDNWSWGVTSDPGNTSPVYSGSYSISVLYNAGWGGLSYHTDTPLSTAQYLSLRFQIHGGSSGAQGVRVFLEDEYGTALDPVPVTLVAGAWQEVDIPLTDLGSPAAISRINWQDTTNGPTFNTFYLDDIVFVYTDATPLPTATPAPTSTPGPGPALSVDAAADQHAINPLIYGMSFTPEDLLSELPVPVNRFGGNSTTRYNWQNDSSNRALDWYFENIPNNNPHPEDLPDGSRTDLFHEANSTAGSETLLTIPMIGWTPKSRQPQPYDCGFSVTKYGPQESVDPWQTDCGNGIDLNGDPITGNDPTDTSIAIDETFVQDWMFHLIGKYGTGAAGGVRFYALDNEPMLWNSTHRDVYPDPLGYDEIRDLTYQYAAAIKTVDPTAMTMGPVVWGWTAYFYSALDAAPGGAWWQNPLDRLAHGDVPFIDWYLQQMQAYETTYGSRILDYLDIHFYPQCGVALRTAGDTATQTLRLRSTRALWDPTYTDESWISEPVRLIPRMKDWVDTCYPGTLLAVTEYNWGGLEHINGALTQADLLGIFGREGLDMACLWGAPDPSEPGAYAFRMYLNYDGAGSRFGETAVQAVSANEEAVSVFASMRDSDGALLIMAVNKSGENSDCTLSLAGFDPSAAAESYRYSSGDLTQIVRLPDVPVDSSGFEASLSADSITLYVLYPSGMQPLPVVGGPGILLLVITMGVLVRRKVRVI